MFVIHAFGRRMLSRSISHVLFESFCFSTERREQRDRGQYTRFRFGHVGKPNRTATVYGALSSVADHSRRNVFHTGRVLPVHSGDTGPRTMRRVRRSRCRNRLFRCPRTSRIVQFHHSPGWYEPHVFVSTPLPPPQETLLASYTAR